MSEQTERLSLPFIVAGQAQKEVSHNEALQQLDMLVQPVVVAVGLNTPPASPSSGQCWTIGSAPSGVWAGKAGHIACWTLGGWRFAAPVTGMHLWSLADALPARFDGIAWVIGDLRGQAVKIEGNQIIGPRKASIPNPSGGSAVDAEARLALVAVLDAMRGHGLISA